MSPGWTLTLGVLGGMASVVVILEWLGIKPKGLSWGLIMPLANRWKLILALTVIGINLGFIIYGFYRALHPKIVERIVEKVVEKPTPVPCPEQKIPPTTHAKTGAKPSQPPLNQKVEIKDSGVSQQSSGDCSPNQIGNNNNNNCGPPPLKLQYSLRTVPSNEQGGFGFPSECLVRSHIRIVPNQSVPSPVRVALDFDYPVTQIASSVENVGAQMGGGPFRIGVHAITSPVSPGIGPHNALIVEVCSDTPVKLTGEPHMVN